nr:MAG TPA: hypothetical protein [Caudoviricetes sp.]
MIIIFNNYNILIIKCLRILSIQHKRIFIPKSQK